MGIEATGKVHMVTDTKQVSERFSKRSFVLELADNPKYPQLVEFQLTGDRCEQLDGINVGDEVRVEFSLRGREWHSPKGETKYFNTLDVWKLELVGQARVKQAKAQQSNGGGQAEFGRVDDDGDIPFLTCEFALEPSPIAKVFR
jgi:hypothetical protein